MFEPDTVYAKIAYDAILLYVKANTKLEKRESEIPDALKLKLGCYVTIFDGEGNLRSSYGTPNPKQDYLFHAIIENAVEAAKGDSNTPPIQENELSEISVQVDVLSAPKNVEDISLLKPHKHGLILENKGGEKTIILANQDGISSPEEMVQQAKQQAGISSDEKEETLNLHFFTTTKYK
jgi:AMMECR1 domain-containing protein